MALFFYKEKHKDIRAAAYLRLSICGDADFLLEEIRHERVRDCKEAVRAGNPDTFYAPMSVGLYEKYLTGKGPCMAASFCDKGSGKSSLHRDNGL